MTLRVASLPAGALGFDCNEPVTPHAASLMWDHGYRFAVRYVRRGDASSINLSVSEILTLMNAGLGLMVVQHVAKPGWHPTGALGQAYGAIAAEEARSIGVPPGVSLWCDLEGVGTRDEHGDRTDPRDVISFCNAWFDAVKGAGYDPGLYVGDSSGLTAHQLYFNLKFRRYWGAYNLNHDQIPEVRGLCMKQGAYPSPSERVAGVPFEYDEDTIQRDHFNNLPTLLLPGDPG